MVIVSGGGNFAFRVWIFRRLIRRIYLHLRGLHFCILVIVLAVAVILYWRVEVLFDE